MFALGIHTGLKSTQMSFVLLLKYIQIRTCIQTKMAYRLLRLRHVFLLFAELFYEVLAKKISANFLLLLQKIHVLHDNVSISV